MEENNMTCAGQLNEPFLCFIKRIGMEHNDLSNEYFIDNADKKVIFIIGQ